MPGDGALALRVPVRLPEEGVLLLPEAPLRSRAPRRRAAPPRRVQGVRRALRGGAREDGRGRVCLVNFFLKW